MKKILISLMLLPIFCAAQTNAELKRQVDSLDAVSKAYRDTANAFFYLIQDYKDKVNITELKAQTQKILSDSLQVKINKMLVFHFYACSILENVATDGTIVRRQRFVDAVKSYHKHYKE